MTASPSSPSRGTIIVDATSLIDMEMAIDPKFLLNLENPPKTYLEILPALAKQGYRIIIPETAAYESASVLAGGINLSNYFSHYNPNHRHSNPFWKHEVLVRFLKDVSDNKYPSITISRTPAQTNMGEILEALREKTSSLDILQKDTRAYCNGVDDLKEIQKRKMPGDVSEVMGKLFDERMAQARERGEHVFLLSSNRKRMDFISQRHPGACLLTLAGALAAAVRNGSVARYIGFDRSVRPNEMARDIGVKIEQLSDGAAGAHLAEVDITGSIYQAQKNYLEGRGIAVTPQNIKLYSKEIGVDRDLPFSWSLSKVSVPQEQLPKLKQESKGPKYGKPMADGFVPRTDDGDVDKDGSHGWRGHLSKPGRPRDPSRDGDEGGRGKYYKPGGWPGGRRG